MSSTLAVVTDPREIYQLVRDRRASGQRVGLVPTMGALHEGHLSLVRRSYATCDETVVTIFVNPTQFGPGEDFEQYPRTFESDVEKLASEGVGLVFAPAADAVYRKGHSTFVKPPAVAEPLEGTHRPGHFRGVATVVLKLFNTIGADIAFFGQKDYQQSLVIRHMVADLDLPIEIETCPTVREPDGLSLSSRNAYLTPEQRLQALAISQALNHARAMHAEGEESASAIEAAMRTILSEAGIDSIDYVALVDPATLQSREHLGKPTIALIAAHVGDTRLIDNAMIATE